MKYIEIVSCASVLSSQQSAGADYAGIRKLKIIRFPQKTCGNDKKKQ